MNFKRFPQWAKDSVFYQIFPDRFHYAEGRTSRDHVNLKWNDNPDHFSFMGGNLDGIREKLDYIADLGVNAVWLNPILEAPSNHKYDTEDYANVSRHFGGNKSLKRLVKEAHRKDIRVILDAVCGHCSTRHKFFQDLLQKQKESKYFKWFQVRTLPVKIERRSGFNHTYECWHGHPGLPRFDTYNPDVQQYLSKTYERWLTEFDLDGFRLDAIETISMPFWEKFYNTMKKAKPDCLLLGELWTRDYRFIDPPRLDTLTDFPLLHLLVETLGTGKVSAEEFAVKLNIHREQLPVTHVDSMYNFLSNHDIMRVGSRPGISGKRLRLLYAFLLTYTGIPGIYYGDEIGMKGGNPPASRNAMIWEEEKWDAGLKSFIKELIHLRKKTDDLTQGKFEWIYADRESNIFVFSRGSGNERTATAVNLHGRRSEFELRSLLKNKGWEIVKTLLTDNHKAGKAIFLKGQTAGLYSIRRIR